MKVDATRRGYAEQIIAEDLEVIDAEYEVRLLRRDGRKNDIRIDSRIRLQERDTVLLTETGETQLSRVGALFRNEERNRRGRASQQDVGAFLRHPAVADDYDAFGRHDVLC